jgi:hypothetical protein
MIVLDHPQCMPALGFRNDIEVLPVALVQGLAAEGLPLIETEVATFTVVRSDTDEARMAVVACATETLCVPAIVGLESQFGLVDASEGVLGAIYLYGILVAAFDREVVVLGTWIFPRCLEFDLVHLLCLVPLRNFFALEQI